MVVLAGVGTVAACSGPDPAPPTTTSKTSTTTTTTPEVQIELIDAGDAPRRPVRIELTEGDRALVTITTDLAVDQAPDQGPELQRQRLATPPISQVVAYEVTSVDAVGATVRFRIDDVGVATEGTDLTLAQALLLQAELEPLVGIEGRGRLSPLGAVDDLEVDVPSGVDPVVAGQIERLEDQLLTSGAVLPRAPVGVGATWISTSPTRTTTVTVTALDRDRLTYTSTIVATTGPQDLDVPGLDDGTSARLRSSELEGTSTGFLALRAPASGWETTLLGPQEVTITGPAGDAEVRQQLRITTQARPTPAG